MDAAAEFIYLDVEAQETLQHVPRLEDAASIDARQFAHLLADSDHLMALPGADAADAIEIELDAQQMDALLEGRWAP